MAEGLRPRTPRWLLISLYVAAFVAAGAVAPYIAVYFQDLGLSLDAIGLLAAAIALCALFGSPIWGALADQRLGTRAVLFVASLGAAIMAIVVGLTDLVVVASVFAILFSVASAGIDPVLNAVTLDSVADNRSRFALFRVWGSAAFVVTAIAVGVVIDATTLRAMFVPLVVSLVVTALLALGIPGSSTSRASRPLGGLSAVVRARPMAAFLVASLIVWGASEMVNDFFAIYLVSLDAPSTLVGSAFAISALVEVPALLLFPLLSRRLGVSRVIVIGAGLFLLRTVLLLLTNDPDIATATMIVNGAANGLLLVGGITYVAGIAPSDRAATAQGVFLGVAAGLAAAVGPALAGIIAGLSSLQTMFVLSAAVSIVGLFAIAAAVTSPRFVAVPPDAGSDAVSGAPTTP